LVKRFIAEGRIRKKVSLKRLIKPGGIIYLEVIKRFSRTEHQRR